MESEAQWLAWTGLRWLVRGLLVLAAVTFLLQWLLPRLRKLYRHYLPPSRNTSHSGDSSDTASVEQRNKQKSVLHEMQEKHQTKATSFKEKILQPREEAKKQQKEQEFYRFLGPAWKGKGQVLGEDADHMSEQEKLDEFEEDLNPNEMAAVRRRIQKPAPQPAKPATKPKRVITLPEEPLEMDKESVLVLLRSPIQTVYQRRFRYSDTVQTLLDFMTVSGFNQTFNTLCTSYPRQDLADDKDRTLLELGFTRRVTLNIEERDL